MNSSHNAVLAVLAVPEKTLKLESLESLTVATETRHTRTPITSNSKALLKDGLVHCRPSLSNWSSKCNIFSLSSEGTMRAILHCERRQANLGQSALTDASLDCKFSPKHVEHAWLSIRMCHWGPRKVIQLALLRIPKNREENIRALKSSTANRCRKCQHMLHAISF